MYVVFARKYRPLRFEDVVGQEHVTRTLQNAVRNDRVAHAYLFCGPRGVGKTSVARILAKALNCAEGPTPEPCCECDACVRIASGSDIDVMEIDGASNNSVDNVRELRQNVGLSPARSRYKVYYIDEVHMLSASAFNALLKTLEEPPAHVKFIFSTTDPRKIPETVHSRCQRFDFHRIPDARVVDTLGEVCAEEGLQVEEGGLAAIARAARGSMRDALGVLDQLAAFGDEVHLSDVLGILGAVDRGLVAELVEALAAGDTPGALRALQEALAGGTSVDDFASQFSRHLRDLLVASYCGPDDPSLAGAAADAKTLGHQCELLNPDQLTYMIQLMREATVRARREGTGRIALELAFIRMSRLSELVPIEDALERLESGGGAAPAGRGAAAAGAAHDASAAERKEAVGVLRRMREKLRTSKAGSEDAAVEAEVAPEGISKLKYRQLLASAESPDVAEEALEQQSLMEAFIQADESLGLSPQRLERHSAPEEEPEEGEESPLTEGE
ncbi:MAG: DNA polymerase III subunit gamma/tau [Candidatus Brocadiaceae bacterium]|jgi:DNA polymerase-3 subunit gamma/tau